MANYYSYNTSQVQADINMDNAIKEIQNQLLNIPTDTQLGLKANQTDLDTTNANVLANTTSLAERAAEQGDLTQLNTTDKSSVVNALKEIKTQANSNATSISNNATAISNISNGSPKGTYATLTALQTAFPTGTTGVYIVTADGKWYYWNGSAWTAGGTYQSTGFADKSVSYNLLTDTLKTLLNQDFVYLTPTFTTGSYISSSGNIGTSTGFEYSAPIQLLRNETIVFYAQGFNTNVSMITTCDSAGNSRVVQKVCADSNFALFTYTATQDTYVEVSCQTYNLLGKLYNYQALINLLGLKNIYQSLSPTYTLNNYISGGTGNVSASTGFQYSNLITLNFGETITVTATGYLTNVGIISEWDSTGATWLGTLAKSIDSTNRTYTYTALKDKVYVKVSGQTSPAMIVQKYNRNTEISSATNTRVKTLELNASSYFGELCQNIICIGDSLTEGFNGSVVIPNNYPFYLGKMSAWNITNAGHSGYTTEHWWSAIAPTFNYANFDTAIIFLGTNEGLTDTLSADTASGNYTTYPDTGTGDYCKIIEYIKSQNPTIKIFLCTIFASHTDYLATTNSVINQIAAKYSLPIIDTNILPFTSDNPVNPLIHPIDNVHMGKVGYLELAQYIYSQMVNYISNNLSKFNS